jgi:hypothetical protein
LIFGLTAGVSRQLGQSKIKDLDLQAAASLANDHEVSGLEVAMDEVHRLRSHQSLQ